MQWLLVDSNVYLRLANHVPQFFGGHPDYELRTVAGVDSEFRSRRLRSKYAWPDEPPHPANRAQWQLSVATKDAQAIRASQATVLEFAEATLAELLPQRKKYNPQGAPLPFLSPIDLRLLCHGIHFDHGLLTDELPLTKVAKVYGVPVVNSLQLLRYFLGQKIVDMRKVEAIVQFWQYDDDVPHKKWAVDYKKLFKKDPPPHPSI